MLSNPESFISPNIWTKYRAIIQSSLASDDQRILPIFSALNHRNSRLTRPGRQRESDPRQQLIRLLDTSLSQPLANDFSKQCWKLDNDKAVLIKTVLEWSTSSHRPGVTKIFVGVRILRSWSRAGADITAAILDFLDSTAVESGRSKSAVYHLISELVRSEHFSTPAYLQWLIARGGLYDTAEVAQDGPVATRLLAELPTHNLSDGILGLRRTLLSRAAFSVDDEDENTRLCKIFINRSLPGMQANMDLEEELEDLSVTGEPTDRTSEVSRTSRSEIGLWLRQKVELQMIQPTIPRLDEWDASPMKGGTSAITIAEFNTVRQYLEAIDDYSMLADVLTIVSSSNDAEVLASCVDTVNLHLETFAAIGALKDLFDILLARLRSLTEDQDSLPTVFLASISELALRLPEHKTVAQQLAQELARSNRKTAADAYSPVSDHMAGVLQTAEADIADEIEKVLANRTSMDQPILKQLFQTIILRLEASWEKSAEQQRSCGLLLTRLRTFNPQQFDVLIAAWVHRFQQMKHRPTMVQVFGPLISFGCLTLNNVVVSGATIVNDHTSSQVALDILALLVTPPNLPEVMSVEEAYRLRIKQRHMQKDHPLETLLAIRHALEESIPSADDDSLGIAYKSWHVLHGSDMQELLQRLVIDDTDATSRALVLPLWNSNKSREAIETIINKLLVSESDSESGQALSTEVVLNLADDLTLPFCQLKLASLFSKHDSDSPGTEDVRSNRLEAFDKAIRSAVASGNNTWARIVPLLDISIARHLRQRAEIQFLALLPSTMLTNEDEMSNLEDRITQAEKLLYIIDATAYSIPAIGTGTSNATNTLAAEIVATLNNIWVILSNSPSSMMKGMATTKWLPLILAFITIHISAFDATKSGHESRAKALLALSALLLELEALNTNGQAVRGLMEQTFDIALHLVDALPDDIRQHCIRTLRYTSSNSRICYLFSFARNPSEWLVLSQKDMSSSSIGPMTSNSGGGSLSTSAGGSRANKGSEKEKLVPFPLRRWEMLGEPTPNVGENDTSLSLTLFGARRG
jgi:mediator of RNA polymerase II transcription subunit 12